MNLAPLKNTHSEPAPTEDTSAAKQEQASLQEQLARSKLHDKAFNLGVRDNRYMGREKKMF